MRAILTTLPAQIRPIYIRRGNAVRRRPGIEICANGKSEPLSIEGIWSRSLTAMAGPIG